MKIVTDFEALKLKEMIEAHPQITAALNAAKEKRRQELESEIRSLGLKPGEAKKPAAAGVKYRSKLEPSRGWGGRGAMATWLKDEMAATGLPLEAFRV